MLLDVITLEPHNRLPYIVLLTLNSPHSMAFLLPRFSENLVTIHVTSVNRMTLLVLPGMEERGRGIIINVSSLAVALPAPLRTLYAATKVMHAANICFTELTLPLCWLLLMSSGSGT